MVWAISQIRRSIKLGRLKILDPSGRPIKNLKFGKNGQVSLEVHLGPKFRYWKEPNQNNPMPFDISSANGIQCNDFVRKHLKNNTQVKKVTEKGLIVEPGKLYLWEIYEYIKMPEDVFARIETKSKWAQIGISAHNTAPAIHPGWPQDDPNLNERIVLEITNTSKFPIVLYSKNGDDPGTIIAQVFFESVKEASTCRQTLKEFLSWFSEVYTVYLGWAANRTTIGRCLFFIITVGIAIFTAKTWTGFLDNLF